MRNHSPASPQAATFTRRAMLDRAVRIFATLVVVALGIASTVPTALAQGASQIVISCTTPGPNSKTSNGCRSSELSTTPPSTPPIINAGTLYIVGGFWVWCQNPNTSTPYGNDCNGAMYIAEVTLATGAAKYETTSISGSSSAGGSTGLQVTVTTKDGDVTCTLDVPLSPTSGGTNQLAGLFNCNSTPIVFSNAVVRVTGQ